MLKQNFIRIFSKTGTKFFLLILLALLFLTRQATPMAATSQNAQPNLPTVIAGLDLPEGTSADSLLVPMTLSNPAAMGDGTITLDNGHEDNPLTIVLDFIDPAQANEMDAVGNVVSSFDVTEYGFAANQHDAVVNAVIETVREHYFTILTTEQHGSSPLPAGKDLALDVVVGEVGTPPSNGATEYYYLLIGSFVSSEECTGALGCAATNVIRNSIGIGPNFGFSSGGVVGSIFTDNINSLGSLTPSNALKSGNIDYTRHAIAGTTSHEVAHALSLLHLNKAGSATPTGLPPIMGTGRIDLPNQDRINDRDFAISGQNSQEGGVTKTHIQQLMGAVGVHNSEDLGDAPDSYGSLRASDGVRHLATGPYLGAQRDTEADANSPLNGSGDDLVGVNDDDGITISMLSPDGTNQTVTLTVQSSSNAFLDAWIDFDRDGTFDHPTEHLNGGTSIAVVTGTNTINFTLPDYATMGISYGRFRLSSAGNLSPTGWSADGEVEDYSISFFGPPVYLPIVLKP